MSRLDAMTQPYVRRERGEGDMPRANAYRQHSEGDDRLSTLGRKSGDVFCR
jgi:hypothetical protein